jgi:aspartate/glutamate/glutamine transport system substrate-binding protein
VLKPLVLPQITEPNGRFLSVLFLAVLLLSLVFGFTACSAKRQEPNLLATIQHRGFLIAGVKYDSKPFGYLDESDNTLKGFDIDLLKELSLRLFGSTHQLQFRQVFSSTRLVVLNTRSIDLIAATMSITPERKRYLSFSTPYYKTWQKVLVKTTSPVKRLSQLQGKTVLYTLGASSASHLQQKVQGLTLKGFKTPQQAFNAFLNGEGDAVTTDSTLLNALRQGHPEVRVLEEAVAPEVYGLALRKEPETEAFRQKINQLLAAMQADGTLAKLQAKWAQHGKE